METSFQSRLETYSITNAHALTSRDFLVYVTLVVRGLITKHLKRLRGLKGNLLLPCDYKKGAKVNEFNFKTQNSVIIEAKDISEYYRRAMESLVREMDEIEARGSGWTLARVKILDLRINKHNMLRGSSDVELPKWIRDKKSVLNVKNSDEQCFRWAVLSALHPADKDPQRVRKNVPYRE